MNWLGRYVGSVFPRAGPWLDYGKGSADLQRTRLRLHTAHDQLVTMTFTAKPLAERPADASGQFRSPSAVHGEDISRPQPRGRPADNKRSCIEAPSYSTGHDRAPVTQLQIPCCFFFLFTFVRLRLLLLFVAVTVVVTLLIASLLLTRCPFTITFILVPVVLIFTIVTLLLIPTPFYSCRLTPFVVVVGLFSCYVVEHVYCCCLLYLVDHLLVVFVPTVYVPDCLPVERCCCWLHPRLLVTTHCLLLFTFWTCCLRSRCLRGLPIYYSCYLQLLLPLRTLLHLLTFGYYNCA